jgi:hypothetical protein
MQRRHGVGAGEAGVPITAFGELGVTVTSTYIGQHGQSSPHTSLSPASAAPSSKPNFGRRSFGHPRERCLLDHVHQLQEALVARTGGTVAIDIAPGALTRATPV